MVALRPGNGPIWERRPDRLLRRPSREWLTLSRWSRRVPTLPRIVMEVSALMQPFRRSDEGHHTTTNGPQKPSRPANSAWRSLLAESSVVRTMDTSERTRHCLVARVDRRDRTHMRRPIAPHQPTPGSRNNARHVAPCQQPGLSSTFRITRPGVNVAERSEPTGLFRLALIRWFCRVDYEFCVDPFGLTSKASCDRKKHTSNSMKKLT